jgi:hypothetical protein
MATITKVGSYTGTGAALNVSVGFVPDYVRIVDATGLAVDEWFNGMTAGTSYSTATAGTQSVRAAPGGVTAFAGTAATAGQGFTVGTALSTAARVYRYVAVQNGPGAA